MRSRHSPRKRTSSTQHCRVSGSNKQQSTPQKGEQAEKGEEGEEKKSEAEEKKSEPAEKKDEAQKGAKGQKGEKGAKGSGTQGQGKGRAGEKGEPDDENNPDGPAKDKRREAALRQEQVADKARELEEKLKKLEIASDLAKVRMTKAAETAEKASSALSRGRTKEATETAKAGASMLHELARQVKGELARDVAQELAMARDLADELADREAELSRMPGGNPPSGTDQGPRGEEPGQSENDGRSPSDGGRGGAGRGGWGDLTDAERLERLEEAAKTLEHWLKDASLRAEGDPADRIRELLEERDVTRIVERMRANRRPLLGRQKAGGLTRGQRAVEGPRVARAAARSLASTHRRARARSARRVRPAH